ncbi:hypothetical protein RH858_11820 [Halalkaliarchaeum sp. AArc-GB]|uniref:hypothetical protein n=1 Tax=Halalkaliarchaeum sp. AArc-GB TaxID=3074078 RepID=UPI0028556AED|nr:hypothetical protein [Halalkaliarchaeum sp. AArc-GB]MDR5673829.1 hypothetical protein [Halalkaliarchaeum sp. AArc-GB]
MSITFAEVEVPTGLVGAVVVLFVASLVYGLLIMGSLIIPLAVWAGLLCVGIFLLVVYLLYRIALAVEEIAETL